MSVDTYSLVVGGTAITRGGSYSGGGGVYEYSCIKYVLLKLISYDVTTGAQTQQTETSIRHATEQPAQNLNPKP